jgi:hypothetical protein
MCVTDQPAESAYNSPVKSDQLLMLKACKLCDRWHRGQWMHRLHVVAGCLFGCFVFMATTLDGAQPLRMRVTPAMSLAPGFLTVRVNVEAAPENRLLQVFAESPDFYRSSEMPLEGAHAAPLAVFEFRNLPSGTYQITSVLIGENGQRASVGQVARVQPAAGR